MANILETELVARIGKPALYFVIAFIIYLVFKSFLLRALMKRVRTKKMKHSIIMFTNVLTYIFVGIALIIIVFYATGNSLAFGISAGFLTAALGWALQRPITGIAAWIMVIVKRPFRIGDRILIGKVKGDVIDITLTHVHLKEVGGTINSEETSGRIVMFPNSIMFEQNIYNYSLQDEFILDDVGILITYESNLDEAIKICKKSARNILKDSLQSLPKEPYVRVQFSSSGIDIKTRYYVKAVDRIKTASDVTKEIFKEFNQAKDVEIAYPHTEVVLRKK